jgi:signal transduction histidine kinase
VDVFKELILMSLLNPPKNGLFQRSYKIPLRLLLVLPFVTQIFAAVSLVGYLSFKNGQEAVNRLSFRLSSEISDRVDQHLDDYLTLPHQLGTLILDAINTELLDIHDFQKAGRYLWKRAETYPNISFIGYYLPTGEGIAAQRWLKENGITIVQHSLADGKDYEYATDAQGNRTRVIDATPYFAPNERWYKDAVQAGKPIWSQIYAAEGFVGYVAASAVYPIYDRQHQLLGVISIDLLLSDISRFLQNLDVSPHGKVFIMERDGLLIGNSGSQLPYNTVNGETQRLNALNNPDAMIQATARYLLQQFGSLGAIESQNHLEFFMNNEKQFVQVLPWSDNHGLSWLVVVVIPESDFMEQIRASTRTTIVLCLVALLLATVLGIYTSQWITRPILHLGQVSRAIASEQLDQTVSPQRIAELDNLAQAFNQMAKQLQVSFHELEMANNVLEQRVKDRTLELTLAKEAAETEVIERKQAEAKLQQILEELRQAQFHLIQSEKMSSLGQMVAGVAHEINNPMNFVYGNIIHVNNYIQNLLQLLHTYQQYYPNPVPEVQLKAEDIELDFLVEDLPQVLNSMQVGAERIQQIVLSLRNFSRLDESDIKFVNIHDGIDNTLMILGSRLKETQTRSRIEVVREYGDLPLVECYAGQLNQVFMNLLSNAIDALEDAIQAEKLFTPTITIRTERVNNDWINIQINDNGVGIPQEIEKRLFDPFFTSKPVGKGTGMGLAISYQIVAVRHSGTITHHSEPNQSTTFIVKIPIQQ